MGLLTQRHINQIKVFESIDYTVGLNDWPLPIVR